MLYLFKWSPNKMLEALSDFYLFYYHIAPEMVEKRVCCLTKSRLTIDKARKNEIKARKNRNRKTLRDPWKAKIWRHLHELKPCKAWKTPSLSQTAFLKMTSKQQARALNCAAELFKKNQTNRARSTSEAIGLFFSKYCLDLDGNWSASSCLFVPKWKAGS